MTRVAYTARPETSREIAGLPQESSITFFIPFLFMLVTMHNTMAETINEENHSIPSLHRTTSSNKLTKKKETKKRKYNRL